MRSLFEIRKGLLAVLAAMAFAGCELIPENERLLPVDDATGVRKHVLLEFTGFRCVNCPAASELANTLAGAYEGQVYVVSLHPASNPFTHGKYDYTCPAADSIYQLLGGTPTTPFPAGSINMSVHDGERLADMSEWATWLYNEMQQDQKPLAATEAHVSYWLVEDSVPGVQAMPDGSVNTAYYHRHVLRDIRHSRSDIAAPEGSNTEQLYLLTVYSDPNDQHIIDAYEEKLFIDNALHAGSR